MFMEKELKKVKMQRRKTLQGFKSKQQLTLKRMKVQSKFQMR